MDTSLLENYEKVIEIRIGDRVYSVPENNTLLRVLQFLCGEISYSRFCWNGDCRNCLFAYRQNGTEGTALACCTEVKEGMEVSQLPEGIRLP